MSEYSTNPPNIPWPADIKDAADLAIDLATIAHAENVARVLGAFDDHGESLEPGPRNLIVQTALRGLDSALLRSLLDRARIEGQKSQHKVMKDALKRAEANHTNLDKRLANGVRAMAKLAVPGDGTDGIIPAGMTDCYADGVAAALAALLRELRWAHPETASQIADDMIRQQAAGIDPLDADDNHERPAPYGPLHNQ